ncbi:transcription factor tau subunit sfc4 [Ceratobasidium sp. AG-Ba]|nr:transcription factor tau subunit sfc4 [Ceratobasidium sp. AG-Ba]
MSVQRHSLESTLPNDNEYIPTSNSPSAEELNSLVASSKSAHGELDSWRTEIQGWRRARGTNQQQDLLLYGVQSKSMLGKLLQVCEELGVRPRYFWESASQTLELSMPGRLHEVPWSGLNRFESYIEAHLRRVGVTPCGFPTVSTLGSATTYLNNGDQGEPDGCFTVYSATAFDDSDPHITTPLIFETAFSYSMLSAQKKACKFIYHMDNAVRAVVICELAHIKSPSSKFRAEIGVWVAEPVAPVVAPCQAGARPHFAPLRVATAEDNGLPGALGPIFTHTNPDGTQMTIRRRNREPIVLVDEALDAVPPAVLRLHVYDLISPCTQLPNGRVHKALEWIDIPLTKLQYTLPFEVGKHRALLRAQAKQNP